MSNDPTPPDPSLPDPLHERVKDIVHDLLSDTTKLPHVWSQIPGYLETNQPILQGIVGSQISPSAAIPYSKLSLTNSIVNADVNTAAAIAYSKLALALSIVNGDISAAAAITYSKLNLAGSIVNADVSTSASVIASKIAGYPTDATKFLNGGGTWTVPASSLTTSTKSLTANVTISASSTYVDGPPLTLAAGTWLLVGTITLRDTVGSPRFTAKLWDGTTVYSSAEGSQVGTTGHVSLPLSGIVSPGGSTTYKISAASTLPTNGLILAACVDNGAGNNASILNAVKIA